MSTELFATDAYLRTFDAAVVEVDRDGGRVALARTAFYPRGGGQPHDLGTLRTDAGLLPVTRASGSRADLALAGRAGAAAPGTEVHASWTGTGGTC